MEIRDKLKRTKKLGAIGVVASLIALAISFFTYKEADDALMQLDKIELNKARLK